MAKNFNSVSFTVLLLIVVLMVSTEIPKSEAQQCPKFLGECGTDPFPGTNADCLACCKTKYGSALVCKGAVEGDPKHCHCYGF